MDQNDITQHFDSHPEDEVIAIIREIPQKCFLEPAAAGIARQGDGAGRTRLAGTQGELLKTCEKLVESGIEPRSRGGRCNAPGEPQKTHGAFPGPGFPSNGNAGTPRNSRHLRIDQSRPFHEVTNAFLKEI